MVSVDVFRHTQPLWGDPLTTPALCGRLFLYDLYLAISAHNRGTTP